MDGAIVVIHAGGAVLAAPKEDVAHRYGRARGVRSPTGTTTIAANSPVISVLMRMLLLGESWTSPTGEQEMV